MVRFRGHNPHSRPVITSLQYTAAVQQSMLAAVTTQTLTFPTVHTYVDVKAGGSGSAFDRLGGICSDVTGHERGKLVLSWESQGNRRRLCGREYSGLVLRCSITLIYDIIIIGKHCQEIGNRRAENGRVTRSNRVIFSLFLAFIYTKHQKFFFFLVTAAHPNTKCSFSFSSADQSNWPICHSNSLTLFFGTLIFRRVTYLFHLPWRPKVPFIHANTHSHSDGAFTAKHRRQPITTRSNVGLSVLPKDTLAESEFYPYSFFLCLHFGCVRIVNSHRSATLVQSC